MLKEKYNKIIKYKIMAECVQPMHIGSALGDKSEVLIHPVDNKPFIQASSLAGVLRDIFKKNNSEEMTKSLFGDSNVEGNKSSNIKITDGIFEGDVILELRPRLHINKDTGTVSSAEKKGSGNEAGHKFNMEYIGAGAKFTFCVYLYADEYSAGVEDIFAELNSQSIQIGGQKSNGCGFVKLTDIMCKEFDMTNSKERIEWQNEEDEDYQYENTKGKLNKLNSKAYAYEVVVMGKTEGDLLVKSILVDEYKVGTPDAVNIRNAKGEYIIPGSSLKGAIRSQMERIAEYLNVKNIIESTFGKKADGNSDGATGNIFFCDSIVGKKEENEKHPISHRIRIDKFTGGVVHGALMSEQNVCGEISLKIGIRDKGDADRTCGLLLMALRDMAIGTMSIGGGISIGKGIITVDQIEVRDNKANITEIIDFKNGKIQGTEVVDRCIKSIK